MGQMNAGFATHEMSLRVSITLCLRNPILSNNGKKSSPIVLKKLRFFLTYDDNLIQNPYMGFADFRAAFTPETSKAFTVTPGEGSLRQKEDTEFTVKFRAQQPGMVEGYLVIETEDFKKTWKVVGRTG